MATSGRPRIFEAQDVIDKAIRVFWSKGYEAASAEELLESMHIGKGSFYNFFKGGKRELFEKSLDRFSDQAVARFDEDLARAADPIGYLKTFFLSMADAPKTKQLQGCYLGNAMVELAHLDPDLKRHAGKLLQRLEERFQGIIRQAQESRLLKTREAPDMLARHLINLWNGINVTRRMHSADERLRQVIALNLRVLE
jgi:TetR/AcrR family transcriptional regulator, transcriptional repressor for nem operon